EYEEWVSAINSSSGAPVWTKLVYEHRPGDLGVDTSGTVTTTADRAYVTLPNGRVDALGLARGNVQWRSPVLSGCSLSAPSLSGSLAVVDGGGAYVTALSTATGQVAWTADPGGSGCTTGSGELYLPAISGATVYAGTGDGIAALGLTSGNLLWQTTSPANAYMPFSVTKNAVLVSGSSGDNYSLEAFSPSTGNLLWQQALTDAVGSLATFGGLTWTMQAPSGDEPQEAAAFDADTGRLLFSTGLLATDSQYLSPVVDAGHVYVNTGSELECLALPS
ncbi:MAG: PQQ-binding-like beta-propeller repeat protein, partial [Streptosporangiaceae bacterium]